ncbi:unnamed protein product [Arabidopsis thaliana]|uniref:Uncharacterized protein n=2 Tax=Arabidopsis thaliana TaxID=3702 RepID=A0A654F8U5_ARATH|nr:uncharacterized protein AT3G16525 [Arabidopsis thaliana]ANM63684.1 hypothetical protein AT3G16525 [Arabidopsis thaliana]VYS57590.1 unnamed protein product [Arabidopsis thaliana]|eukprot:NP_001325758.1 hypothetical protein AT3G16525 [Arabidopsis thaliana]
MWFSGFPSLVLLRIPRYPPSEAPELSASGVMMKAKP